MANKLLRKAQMKVLCKEKGKTLSTKFFNEVDDFIREKVTAACLMHNAGKKTLDPYVFHLVFRGGK